MFGRECCILLNENMVSLDEAQGALKKKRLLIISILLTQRERERLIIKICNLNSNKRFGNCNSVHSVLAEYYSTRILVESVAFCVCGLNSPNKLERFSKDSLFAELVIWTVLQLSLNGLYHSVWFVGKWFAFQMKFFFILITIFVQQQQIGTWTLLTTKKADHDLKMRTFYRTHNT